MANTKVTILDALVAEIQGLSGVSTATRDIRKPTDQETLAPYVSIIAGDEGIVVEDSTHIRWELPVTLQLVKLGNDIELLVDEIKTAIYAPISIGAMDVHIDQAIKTVVVREDEYSRTQIGLIITYVSVKAGF